MDRKSRIFGFLFIGTTTLIATGFSFFMTFFKENNISLFSVGIILVLLAISIFDFWAAWRFSRVPVTYPNS
jgi:hypothetical protein